MAELMIHTNELVINEGKVKTDIMSKKETKDDKNTALLEEINRKLDLLLDEKEEDDGKANN